MEQLELEQHRVAPQLEEVHYVPEYVSVEQERSVIDEICARRGAWTVVRGRRLQNIGGVVGQDGEVPMIPEPLPQFIQHILSKLGSVFGPKPPNHVLVNEYNPGEGIMAHEDGPSYFPLVAILSLGASAVLRFTRKRHVGASADEGAHNTGDSQVSLLLRPRSLLLFSGAAYTDYLHGIDAQTDETLDSTICNRVEAGVSPADTTLVREGVRYSLTCRRVVRVAGKGVASILRRR